MNASATSQPPSPRPPSLVSIAGRAGHAFAPHAMLQGFMCHARGVELPVCTDSRAHARVRSKRTHDVHLRVERGRLIVACSCPARSLGVDACKHAWAALLEVDRQDGLRALRETRGFLAVDAAPLEPSPATPPRRPLKSTRPAPGAEERDARKEEPAAPETKASKAGTKARAKRPDKPRPERTAKRVRAR